MKIAVTGADGFIGKNLIYSFAGEDKYEIHKITRNTSKNQIKKILRESHFIYHFAGVNRPKGNKTFKKDNFELTKFICDYLKENKLKPSIIFSSSSQAVKRNSYGISKKKCENLLIKLKKENKNNVSILRLPNIYGKWAKPNYNSVVSTFCYNISRNKSIFLSGPKKKVSLLYIDDLIVTLKKFLKKNVYKKIIYKIKFTDKISLYKLSQIIKNFNLSREKIIIPDISSDLKKKLYSTYISFLPVKKILYPLKKKQDQRGYFSEFFKTKNSGQLSVFVAKKGMIRGHHFHHSKVEKFLVVSGNAIFNMFDISSKKKISFKLNDKKLSVVESVPGYQHYIKNIGKKDLIVLLWCNEIFDINKPDTFKI
jgi:UDP-2-acetamido-2,6-beta-L-arabino-hexul-4-ose reductase